MIDNYDSFTYNLVQYFGELEQDVKVFRNDKILQAQSTAETEIGPVTQMILKSASPEVRTTILNQADDAANGVSKFISSSKVQTVGGTKVSKPFTDFFGKNLKFSDKTIEALKKAEMGPPSLSKELVKISKEGVTVGTPKTVLETTKKVAQETLINQLLKSKLRKVNIYFIFLKKYALKQKFFLTNIRYPLT